MNSAPRSWWLFKSEPTSWSWDRQREAGAAGAEWDGVRNAEADANMKAMRRGDRGFFYHSVKEKRIVGIVEVIGEHYPDPTDASGRFGMVDVRALASCPHAATLAEIKAIAALSQTALVRRGRLSVQPVDGAAAAILLELCGFDDAARRRLLRR